MVEFIHPNLFLCLLQSTASRTLIPGCIRCFPSYSLDHDLLFAHWPAVQPLRNINSSIHNNLINHKSQPLYFLLTFSSSLPHHLSHPTTPITYLSQNSQVPRSRLTTAAIQYPEDVMLKGCICRMSRLYVVSKTRR